MANLLGEMNQQLVNAYKEAKMSDVPSVVPLAAGLEKVSDPTNLLALGEQIRNMYATKKTAMTDEEGEVLRDADGNIRYQYTPGAKTIRERRFEKKVESGKIKPSWVTFDEKLAPKEEYPEGRIVYIPPSEKDADKYTFLGYDKVKKEKKGKSSSGTGDDTTTELPKERKFNKDPQSYFNQYIVDNTKGNAFRAWLHENKKDYAGSDAVGTGKLGKTGNFDTTHMRDAWKKFGHEYITSSAVKYKTPFKKLTPLKQTDYQPMEQPEMTDSLANSFAKLSDNNMVMANYIKNTGASLPLPYFDAIKDLNQQLIQKTSEDGSPDAMQVGIGVQNQLSKLTEKERELRMEVADMVINDEISNYRSDYTHTFVSEYMNPNKEVKVGMNPETGQYEFLWKSGLENRFITEGEVRNNLNVFSKGVGSQASVLKQVNSIIKSVNNPNTKQPDRPLFVSLARDIIKKGNKISKIHDDLLSNGSSFAKDIDVILNNSDVVKQIDPTPSTPLTDNDMLTIKDMIINPENPNFNVKIDPDSELGVTDTLLIEYIAGHFEDQHSKAKGSTVKAEKKGIMHYINKYKNKPKGFLASTIKRNNTTI